MLTLAFLGHDSGHKVSDAEAEQAGPESLGDSHLSEQGFPFPTIVVKFSPFVRRNTAPLHQSPSSSPRKERRHTICKESCTYLTPFYHIIVHAYRHACSSTHSDPHTHTYLCYIRYICIVYVYLSCVHCFLPLNDSTGLPPKEPELCFHVAAKLELDWHKVCTYLGLQHHQLDPVDAAHPQLQSKAMEACPNEPELRFHVAAKLGQNWRSVCTYLGLQHYQLDQAEEAHAKLEEKAMEALVMWLQGQGELNTPRSWSTLLQALRGAGRTDIASDVEMGIKNKTLSVGLPNYK